MAASRKRKHGAGRKARTLPPPLYADSRHQWYLLIGIALLVPVLPLLSTVVEQIRTILPPGSHPRVARAMQAHAGALAGDGPTAAVRGALIDMERGRLTEARLEAYRKLDSGNGLYVYLEAARRIEAARAEAGEARESDKGLAGVAPAMLRRASPVRLHHARYRRITREALAKEQFDPRQIEAMFLVRHHWIAHPAPAGPVLRETARRFLAQGQEYRQAGQEEEAGLLENSVARLAFDLVDHEPSPDQALLAADLLVAWAEHLVNRERGGDRETMAQVMEEARRLRTRWHAAATGKEVNLLPCTYTSVWVADAHQRVMSSLMASVVALAACVVVAVLLVALMIASRFVGENAGHAVVPVRDWQRRAWLAALAVALPVYLGMAVLLYGDVAWTWVISSPTLRGVWGVPLSFAVWLLLLAWGAMTQSPASRGRWWLWMMWMQVVLLLAVVLMAWLSAISAGSGSPPAGIQRFRFMSITLSRVALPVLVVGGVCLYGVYRSGLRSHARGEEVRRFGPHEGQVAAAVAVRGGWAVAVRALPLLALITLAVVGWNRAADAAHRRAFTAAMNDPLVARLGHDWKEEHFGAARALWEQRRPGG